MKKLTVVLAGAMLMLSMATVASAFTLRVSTDGTSWTDILDDDSNGVINYTHETTTGFKYKITAQGITSSDSYTSGLSLSSVETLGLGTLYLRLSDVFLTLPTATQISATSGLTLNDSGRSAATGTFSLNTYASNSNTEFDISSTSLISTLSTSTPTALDQTVALNPTLTAPFSLTEELIIHHETAGKSNVSGEFNTTAVPEPGTFALLGAGLLGLGIFGRRRMKK